MYINYMCIKYNIVGYFCWVKFTFLGRNQLRTFYFHSVEGPPSSTLCFRNFVGLIFIFGAGRTWLNKRNPLYSIEFLQVSINKFLEFVSCVPMHTKFETIQHKIIFRLCYIYNSTFIMIYC